MFTSHLNILNGFAILAALITPCITFANTEEEAAYLQVLDGRATKILMTLQEKDTEKLETAKNLIIDQYRSLSSLHDSSDKDIKTIANDASIDKKIAESKIKSIKLQTELAIFKLHRHYIAQLASLLSPEDVEAVKDGMTYGVINNTYGRYLELLPELKEHEKQAILAMLMEAREYAMDGGSSSEKHGWFRKYKGKINNYLSAAGYNISDAERRLQSQSR